MRLHSYRHKINVIVFLTYTAFYCCFVPIGTAKVPSCHLGINGPYRQKVERSIKEFTQTLRGGNSKDYFYNEDDNGSEHYPNGRPINSYYHDSPYDPMARDEADPARDVRDDTYYQEDYEYRHRDVERKPGKRDYSQAPSLPNIPDLLNFGNKKVGMILLAGGVVFTMLGISLFFNKGLMRLGNLLFLAGVPLTIGPGRTAGYFLQPRKARATGCLGLGVFLVMVGWPIFGIALEIFGLLNLFGNMFPILMVLVKQLPGVGSLLGDGSRRRNARSRRDTDYYETERDRGRSWDDRYEYGGDERDDHNEDDYMMERDRYN